MGILLIVVGALSITSGGFKLRDRARAHVGLAPFAVAEVVLGVVTTLGAGFGLARVRPLAWTLIFVVLGTVLWSSIVYMRMVIARHRERDESAAERFRARFGDPS
jgi:uncharacterized membrane protein